MTKKTARPPRSDEEIEADFQRVCGLMEHGKSLRQACADIGIDAGNLMKWIEKDEEREQRYARARIKLIDRMAEQTIEIADEEPERTADGSVDSGAVQRNRLRIDARKWLASKIMPKKYGDKTEVEHSGKLALSLEQILAESGKEETK